MSSSNNRSIDRRAVRGAVTITGHAEKQPEAKTETEPPRDPPPMALYVVNLSDGGEQFWRAHAFQFTAEGMLLLIQYRSVDRPEPICAIAPGHWVSVALCAKDAFLPANRELPVERLTGSPTEL